MSEILIGARTYAAILVLRLADAAPHDELRLGLHLSFGFGTRLAAHGLADGLDPDSQLHVQEKQALHQVADAVRQVSAWEGAGQG